MATRMRPALGPGIYDQITTLSAAIGLTLPTGTGTAVGDSVKYHDANVALIVAESQDVRWRDDGTDPTATVGMLLPKNTFFWYKGDLNKIKFFEAAGGAKLNVTLYAVPEHLLTASL